MQRHCGWPGCHHLTPARMGMCRPYRPELALGIDYPGLQPTAIDLRKGIAVKG